jgi:hypothetical protein
MKNITVTVDDETYRRARIKAAERDTSVSGLVKNRLCFIETKILLYSISRDPAEASKREIALSVHVLQEFYV